LNTIRPERTLQFFDPFPVMARRERTKRKTEKLLFNVLSLRTNPLGPVEQESQSVRYFYYFSGYCTAQVPDGLFYLDLF